jgi:hypothetical protein
MNKTIYRMIAVAAAGLMTILTSNFAIAFPSRGGGNCNSCHTASSPASLVTPSPNPISIKKTQNGLLTLQVANMGTSSTALLSVQGLENALLNATVGAGGGHWVYTTGTSGSSWLSDAISATGPYTMNLVIGGSATTGTYPITVRFAGDGPNGSNTSFNLTITPAGVPGDYNGNGKVDAADYVLWRNGGPLQNEVDAVGIVNAADYTAWRARFGNTSGSGAAFEITAVPEATSCVLMMLGLLELSLFRRKRH